jgi:hypothetical protein
VLAVLTAAGFPLTIPETWPVRPDDDMKKNEWVERHMLGYGDMTPKGRAHFDEVVNLPCLVRIRLSELLGAAADSELPSSFERASVLSLEIQPEIAAHFGRPPPA